jgi:Peptidase inhibitor family I36
MRLTFLAALLGAALLIGTSASSASAAYGVCGSGDFCMWYRFHQQGGLYHFGGSDSNLHNDRFERFNTNAIVGNNTFSVRNKGVADPSGLNDVLVYDLPGAGSQGGASGCIKRGAAGNLPNFWQDRISSYKWVTRSTCNAHFQIPLL